jgi:hypothetical protein
MLLKSCQGMPNQVLSKYASPSPVNVCFLKVIRFHPETEHAVDHGPYP